jgi:hypothetical protein
VVFLYKKKKKKKKKKKNHGIHLQKDWQKHYKNVSKSILAIAVSKSNTFVGSQYDLLQIPHIAPGQSLQSQVVIQSASNQHILGYCHGQADHVKK